MIWLHNLCLWLAEFIVPSENIEYRILKQPKYTTRFKAQIRTRFGWRDISKYGDCGNIDEIILNHVNGRDTREVARRVFPRVDESA